MNAKARAHIPAAQRIFGAVCHLNDLFIVVEADHQHHRSKRFLHIYVCLFVVLGAFVDSKQREREKQRYLVHYAHFVSDIGKHRGFVEQAIRQALVTLASCIDHGAVLHCILDQLVNDLNLFSSLNVKTL